MKTKLAGGETKREKAKGTFLDPFRVKPFKDQPRKRFRGIAKLAASIRRIGQVTPIIVTECDDPGCDAELVDGERRLQACRMGKLPIEVIFRDAVDGADRFALAVAANFCRQEHDCIEIMEAIGRMQADGGSLAEIGEIFGKSLTWVMQHASLAKLHTAVREMLTRSGDEDARRRRCGRGGRLSFSTALLLTGLEPRLQVKLAARIVNKKISLAAARTLVYQQARKAGARVGSDKPGSRISPKAKLQQLWNALETAVHHIDPITCLSYSELSAILALANERERKTLLGQIADLVAGLDGIAKTLRKVNHKAA